MKIISFNFTKMNIEKRSASLDNLKIESRVNLSSIEEAKIENTKTPEGFLTVKWKYSINYSPNIANIDFEGVILISLDKKEASEVLEQWKLKKLNDDFNIKILNAIVKKSSIKAIQLEEDFGLPIHFKLPGFKLNN